jgi:hypothetical protein
MAKSVNVSATGVVRTGPGTIKGIIVNSHSSGTLKLWDNNTASLVVIMDTFTFPSGSGVYNFGTGGLDFVNGIFATVGGTLNCQLLIEPSS